MPKKTRALSAYNVFVKEQKILSFDIKEGSMLERSHAIGSCTDTETGTDTDVLYSSSTLLHFYTTGTSVGPGRLVSTTAAVLVSVSCDRSRYIGKKTQWTGKWTLLPAQTSFNFC